MDITNTKGRIIVIGDVHGTFDVLLKLLDECQYDSKDVLVFLGDLVDRGTQVSDVIDFVMRVEQHQGIPACILGNHEDRHISYDDIEQRDGSITVRNLKHVATRRQLQRRHYDYFRSMPLYVRLPQYNCACVHAGVFPGRSIEKQDKCHLLHAQMLNPAISEKTKWPSKVANDPEWKFWTHYWDGPERIIFGHTGLDKPLVTDKFVGIDTGAVFGRELSAFILPDNRIVSVKSDVDFGDVSREPFVPGCGERPPIQKYVIHGDISTFS